MRSIIENIFNLFRKNKRFVFHVDNSCSGTGPAVGEFNYYKSALEQATGCIVHMISSNNFFGYSYIVYEIVYDKKEKENDE